MKLSTLIRIVTIIVGVILLIIDIPYPSFFLYYALPATVIVSLVGMWEMKQTEKKRKS